VVGNGTLLLPVSAGRGLVARWARANAHSPTVAALL
jgi:hypothetical protein